MDNKISIDLGNGFVLVAEKSSDTVYSKELYVYLEDESGVVYQDLAVVRNAYHYEKEALEPTWEDGKIEILVYGDEGNEDYTDDFTVNIHKEE